jgi:hypothetical protein
LGGAKVLNPREKRAVEIAEELRRYRETLSRYDATYRSFDWDAHPKMSPQAWFDAMDEMRRMIEELTVELDRLLS